MGLWRPQQTAIYVRLHTLDAAQVKDVMGAAIDAKWTLKSAITWILKELRHTDAKGEWTKERAPTLCIKFNSSLVEIYISTFTSTYKRIAGAAGRKRVAWQRGRRPPSHAQYIHLSGIDFSPFQYSPVHVHPLTGLLLFIGTSICTRPRNPTSPIYSASKNDLSTPI